MYHSQMHYELCHMKSVFCLKLNDSMYGKASNSLPYNGFNLSLMFMQAQIHVCTYTFIGVRKGGWGYVFKYFFIIHHLENVTYSTQKYIHCVCGLSEKFMQCNVCNYLLY